MALNIGGAKPTPKKDPKPAKKKAEKAPDAESTSKAMTEAKEALEETKPPGHNPDLWGLKVTDRFTVCRQRESFMLVEHRPSEDKDGNATTKPVKTYHPNIEQVLSKMAKVHTLDLLELETVDNFVDGISGLTTTLRETVQPLLEHAEENHGQASTVGQGNQGDFLGRLNTALKLTEKNYAFDISGKTVVEVEEIYKAIKAEFPSSD